jgi:hypothetical protein
MNAANSLLFNSTNAKYSNSLTDIDVAKTAGFDAMEIHGWKIDRYLEAGHER